MNTLIISSQSRPANSDIDIHFRSKTLLGTHLNDGGTWNVILKQSDINMEYISTFIIA